MGMTVSHLLALILEKKENRIVRDPYWDELNRMEQHVQPLAERWQGIPIEELEGDDPESKEAIRRLKRYAALIDEIPDEPDLSL